MKTITPLILFFLITICTSAQRCDWVDYPRDNTGSNSAIATDAAGNVFTVGTFSNIIIQGDTIPAPYGQNDCILIKYDASGNYLWSKVFGSSWIDAVYKMAIDASGHIYVSASMQDSIRMNDTVLYNTSNYFVLQFDSAGNFLRARFGLSITALAALGNYVYMAYDVAVATVEKLDTNLNVIWSRAVSPPNAISFYYNGDLYVTPNGHLIASGVEFSQGGSPATFDTITINFSPPAYDEVVVISMDTSGSAYWGRPLYPANGLAEQTKGAAGDNAGSVYLTVYAQDTMIFANDTLENTVTPGHDYAAILKYDNAGNEVWGRALYPAANNTSDFYDVMVNSANEILLAGITGIGTFEQLNFTNTPQAIVIKVNPNGNAVWEKHDLLNSGLVKYFRCLAPTGNRYAAAGNFNAQFKLDCFDAGLGNSGSFATVISENPVVDAAFSVNPLDPFTFHFTDQSIGTVVTWTWSFPGGTPVSSTLQNPVVIFSTPGNYTATLVVCDGICCDSDSIQILNVGVDEITGDGMNLSISPNPVSSEVVVRSSETINEITILDVLGNEIYREENINSNLKLQTSNFSPGIYLVNAKVNGKEIMRKFVKL